MKIIILLVIGLMVGLNSYSQDNFTTYDNTFAKKRYDIQISLKGEKFTLYINSYSFDKLHDKGGFMVGSNQLEDFLSWINEAKLKYDEWVLTAKNNNVTELDKPIKIKGRPGSFCYFLYGSDWHSAGWNYLNYNFKIVEDNGETIYLLIISTGKITSSSNQFMTIDGIGLIFSSDEEINSFTSGISLPKIKEFINSPKVKEKDLFKD